MRCPRCLHDNPAEARFCSACGVRLALGCPACAHANAPGSRFCTQCGHALDGGASAATPARYATPERYTPRHLADKIRTSRASLEGERKQVTILFADLRGSMELLADRDPEEGRGLLDPVLDLMMNAVHRYEGTVNQVMGDGIMALFGAPLAHEDHAVRACYSALAMQEAIQRHSEQLRRVEGLTVQMRVGLNSGEVVVRAIGSDLRMDYSAIGQTTHVAARMEQLAAPGTVLITGETLRLAEGYVRVTSLGPVPVRGLPAPVDTYELVGAGGARSRLEAAAARGLTRFVGRQAELAAIQERLTMVAAGRGQVIALVGDAGVGKSRLALEFTRSHRTHGWRVLESTSQSWGKATAFLPVLDLLRRYFRIDDRDDSRTIREKVTGKLLTLDESLKETIPAVLSVFGAVPEGQARGALGPAEQRAAAVDAVRRILLQEARLQPLVLLFDDLHWVDGDTQALLDRLVDSIPTARILLLATYRPEYSHAWGNKSYYAQMRIPPLMQESAEEFLDGLLGVDPELRVLKALLMERTQGNPFFLEESVRALEETDVLMGQRGAYRLVKPLHAVQVPATVQAVLAARIDRLDVEDKRVLQAASVIGKDVPLPLLQGLADLPEPDLRDSLARLQTAEFLYESSFFPDPEYSFAHALTHEVVYHGLLHERRRALHANVVELMEERYADRLAEHVHRLAHHAFRGEIWGKALLYLGRTVARASPASLDAAMEIGPESPAYLWWTGDYQSAVRFGQRQLGVAAGFRDFALEVVARFRLGQTYHSLGDYRRAIEVLRRNVEMLQGDLRHDRLGMAGLPSVFSRAWICWCLAACGEFEEALAVGAEAVQIAEAAADPYTETIAHAGLGHAHLIRHDADAALATLERGSALERFAEPPLLFPLIGVPLGRAYTLTGRTTEAVSVLERVVEQGATMQLIANQSLTTAWLGEASLAAGQPERAVALVARAVAAAVERGERGHEAEARRVLAEVALRCDQPDVGAAEPSFREAVAIAHDLGMRPLLGQCLLGLGKLYAWCARRREADEQLNAAGALFRELGMRHSLAEVEAARWPVGDTRPQPPSA